MLLKGQLSSLRSSVSISEAQRIQAQLERAKKLLQWQMALEPEVPLVLLPSVGPRSMTPVFPVIKNLTTEQLLENYGNSVTAVKKKSTIIFDKYEYPFMI